MSSLYADIGGPGSVAAAKLAVADFNKRPTRTSRSRSSAPIIRTRPTSAPSIANQWFDVDKVDMIVDVPNSGVALATQRDRRATRTRCSSSPAPPSSDLTGPKCNANTVHWTYDTWMLANGTGKAMVKTGGDTWFFLTADYAFGHALERDTAAVGRGERRQGARQGASSAQHQRLLVVPAAGADLEGQGHRPRQCGRRHHQLDQGGAEFGIVKGGQKLAGLLVFASDVNALGLADRAGPHPDRDLVLGPERRQPRLDQALAGRAARASSRPWCRPASMRA